MKFPTLTILEEATYRSKGSNINMPDDMIVIALTCSQNDWFWIKRLLEVEEINEKPKTLA